MEILSSTKLQVETPFENVETSALRRSKRARNEKVLGPEELDSQLISFYLVERNEKSVT